ncbi:MAG: hypothetical protein KJZ65_10590 [Phycisphaerales bacterium]|nr:hypothetical protein [Phycisphaerales bacterium]
MHRTFTVTSLLLLTPSWAGTQPVEPVERRVHATLYTQHARVEPGQVTWAAIEFEIADEWHIYWPGQNDTGMSPDIEWKLPAGWKIGQPRWPAPHRHLSPGELLDHVLEGRAVVLYPLKAPDQVVPGSGAMILAHAEWLVCKDICLAEKQDLMYSFRFSGSYSHPVPETRSDDAPFIAQAHAALPSALPESGSPVKAAMTEDGRLEIHSDAPGELVFSPYEAGRAVLDVQGSCVSETGSLSIAFKADDVRPVQGVISLRESDGQTRHYSFRHPLISSAELDGFETEPEKVKPRPEEKKP